MAELKIKDLPFIKLKESKKSFDFSSYPDVSLQPDVAPSNNIPKTSTIKDMPFIGSKFKLFGVPQTTLEKAGKKVTGDILSLKDKMVSAEKLKEDEPEIFGVGLEQLEKAGEKVKDEPLLNVVDTVVQDVKNLYGDVGVPEEAKIPASKEEKEFFGFNTDIPTTDIPVITDATGLQVIDFPKLKAESTSTYDFISKINKHIGKNILGNIYALGDIAMKTTFLPIQVPLSITGATLEELGKSLGEEKLQDIEEKLFGSRTIKPDEIKEGFEEVAHIQLANMISSAPKPSFKSYFKDAAKQKKIDPKIIVEENVKPKADEIIEKTIDVLAEELAKTQDKTKVQIKTEIVNKVNKQQKETLSKLDKEIKKTKQIKETKKDFSIPKQTKQEKRIPNYIEDAVQMAANFNYTAEWKPGPKYRHMELGVEKAGKGAPKKLLTRDELLANFVRDFDMGIGVTKSKKALGQFLPGFETLRLKYKNDIDTLAHELGHFLDKRIDKISDKYMSDPVMNRELKDISYDVRVVQEGFGEFVRRYLVNPKDVQEAAPKFFEWFDKTLREDGLTTRIKGKEVSLKKPLLNAQANFSQYFQQSPLRRIDSKIGFNTATNSKRMSKSKDILSNLLDDMIGLENMETNLGKLTPDLYMRASNLRQGQSVLKLAVEIGVPEAFKNAQGVWDIRVKKGSKSLNKVLEPVADNLDNFIRYIVAKSAKELKTQNREKLFNDVEIAAGLKLETPLFEKTFKDYIEWNNGIVDFAINYGEILTKDQIKRWNRIWYVPFWRANRSTPGKSGGKQPTAFRGVKALTGGSENLKPIIENMIGNADMLISESIKNRLKLDILDFAKEYRAMGSGRFITPIPVAKSIARDKAIVKDIKNQLYENLFDIFPEVQNIEGFRDFKNFLDWSFEELGSVMSVMTVGKKPTGYERLMPVVRGGQTKYYEVTDPLLFRAIQGMDKKTPLLKGIGQLLTIPKKIKQNSITLSFDFMGANFVRDQLTASILSQSGYKPYYDGINGIITRLKKDPDYIEWMANGGDLAGYYINEGVFKKQLKTFYDKKGISLETVATSPKQILNALEALASLTEVASRLGEYRRAKRQGETITEAVYRSKNISVDFSKRGAYEGLVGQTVQFLTETVPFLRAGMLGTERVYRGIAKDPNRAKIAMRVGLLATTSSVLALYNYTNPLYQSLEDWDKDTHWHVFIPNEKWVNFVVQNDRVPHASYNEAAGYNEQTGEFDPFYSHVRIPKIWEIGAVASSAERTAINLLSGTKNIKEWTNVLKAFFGPYKIQPESLLGASFQPIYETYVSNKDSFTDRPIEYDYEKNFEPELIGEGRVSKTAAKIGDIFNYSPPKLEHLLRGYFGTFANYGLLVSDQFFFNDSEDLSLAEYPLIRRFTKPIPNRNSRYVNEAYNAMAEITRMVSTIREYNKRLNPEKAYNWLQAYAKDQNMTDLEFGKFLDEQDNKKNKLNNELITFNREIGLVDNISDIKVLLNMANIIQNKYGKINYLETIYKKGLNNDIGALKKFLKDDLYTMRNNLAEKYVSYIEQLKGEE